MRSLLVMPLLLGASAAGLWLVWPFLAPRWGVPVPTSRADLVVILDGGEARLAAADRIAARLPQPPHRLLIRCPRTAPPPQALPELLQGFDTATQITSLAQWLREHPPVDRVSIATDPDHTARSVLLARIALAPQGIRVAPVHPPAPSPRERIKLLRDALRLMVWRLTGSTGAWLAPERLARKREDCGV